MIIDVYRKADKRTGLKTYLVIKPGIYRLSRSNGMVHSFTLGNVGSFPQVKFYDSVGPLYICPQSFMTGSFYMIAGFKDYLVLEIFCGQDGVAPQLACSWRDKE